MPGVTQAVPVIEAQAIAMGPSQITGAIVRGLSPEDLGQTRIVAGNITKGDLRGFGQGDYGGDVVVVGARLAEQLGVKPGDNISLISPSGGATAFGGTPLQKAYIVGATFTAGMSQYDQAYIFMPLDQAQLFFGREGSVDAIEVRLTDPDKAASLKAAINRAAGPTALVADWTQRDSSYWGALKVERNVMRLILMLLVVDRGAEHHLGPGHAGEEQGPRHRHPAHHRRGAGRDPADLLHGRRGDRRGRARWRAWRSGVLVSVYIDPIQSFVEWATGQQVFASDVYFLSRLPAKVDWLEVAIIVGFSLAMSMVWTLPPAWRASRLDPVEALRYE